MAGLRCTVTTPEKLVHSGEAQLVVVPAIDGELGILRGHAPLMALLGAGELRINEGPASKRHLFIEGGFVQVMENAVNVLATDAEFSEDIDRAAAEAALAELKASRPEGGTPEENEAHEKKLLAAKTRVAVAGKG